MMELDHSKKYLVIDGHLITLSFAKEPDYDLFGRIKSILLSSGAASQNCVLESSDRTMREKAKEA